MEDLRIANPRYSLLKIINLASENEAIFFTGFRSYIEEVKCDFLSLINKTNFEFNV